MTGKSRATHRQRRKSKSKTNRSNLHKPNGVIGPRVKRVGGERFAIVCVDPAKHRSEWMMADYFGNLLIQPQTLEHQRSFFKLAIAQIREAQEQHGIQDTIVVLERTGNYHLIPKRAFAKAGFETRIVHPFATKQFRMPADPGNKTDETDLFAQHRAAVSGFGLCEWDLESPYREMQLRARHRRKLVETTSSMACRIGEHLHMSMPGYCNFFSRLLEHKSAMAIARHCESPAKFLELGRKGLERLLRETMIRSRLSTIDKVLAWASQTSHDSIENGALHHAIWTDLEQLYQHFRSRIADLEREMVSDLVRSPYVRLLALPGVNVASAAELAGEMGPISRYANANAITGRAGLFPSRYQSDQTDMDRGSIIRQANRRLRCALMRIADNLVCHCAYYRVPAYADEARGIDKRAVRVKVVKKFSRLCLACVAGDQPLKHPAMQQADSILEKLRLFIHDRQAPMEQVLADLKTAVAQFPLETRRREAEIMSEVMRQHAARRRGNVHVGALLPAILARLEVKTEEEPKNRDRP